MSKIVFENLRMSVLSEDGEFSLSLCVESGFAELVVTISLTEDDLAVIGSDDERASFLQAALHHPFQLKEAGLGGQEQRRYLDKILHSPVAEVEDFLTELDHGSANGAISNMVRITCGKDQGLMRSGQWFNR